MSDQQHDEMLRELRELIDQLCDGHLSDEQVARLEELVCASPICSDYYVQAMEIHAGLASSSLPPISLDQFPLPASGNPKQLGPPLPLREVFSPLETQASSTSVFPDLSPPAELLPSETRSWFGTEWKSLMFLALGVVATLGFVGVWQWLRGNTGEPTVANRLPLEITPAAYLVSANGCNWVGSTPLLQTVGNSVQVGDEIALAEGLAEFRLANGVTFSVEGPSSLILASPNSLVLQYGKLTTQVPWTASDFKVASGGCWISAYDAEFGLYRHGDMLEIHAFTGEVQAEGNTILHSRHRTSVSGEGSVVADDAGQFTRATITNGNALILAIREDAIKIVSVGQRADRTTFAAKLSMAGSLPIGRPYVDAVIASRPVGYWRFQSVSDGLVRNEIPGRGDLEVVGNLWLAEGKGNSTAEFRPDSDCYLMVRDSIEPIARGNYSLELWVKPSHFHHGTLLTLLSFDADAADEQHVSFIELVGTSKRNAAFGQTNPGALRFLHRRPHKGASSRDGTSCLSANRYLLRQWQHVVAVKEGSSMRLYVNGKLSKTEQDSNAIENPLRLVIGRQDRSTVLPARQFVGQLDEVAIYNRAISKKEIVRHYDAVKWQTPP